MKERFLRSFFIYANFTLGMYNENQHKLGAVIKNILKEKKIAPNYYETILKQNWENWLGKTIASRTKRIKVYGKKLVIEVPSATLRQEMAYAKTTIIDLINKNLGERYIEEVEVR